jgi:uncharacterized protein YbjT (DUF2867 family)
MLRFVFYHQKMGIKIIITGATGFVGEGVLLECLQHPGISAVLMVNRRPFKLEHPKLKELIVPYLLQTDTYAGALAGYDACFFCAGTSSAGMSEEQYTKVTYDTTIAFADALLRFNKDLIFCFVSGSHTDSSEKGKVMWARVKGRTENMLMKLPFKKEYNFRPGGMVPVAGQQNAKTAYKLIVKVMAILMPGRVSTLKEVGLAMIHAAICGSSKQVIEINDIKELAKLTQSDMLTNQQIKIRPLNKVI